jgi:hypothetical protein
VEEDLGLVPLLGRLLHLHLADRHRRHGYHAARHR